MIPNILDLFIKGAPYLYDKAKDTVANSDTVAALKQQARNWASRVVTLHKRQVPNEYAAEKARLLSTAKTIKSAVEKIFGKMAELDQPGLGIGIAIVVPLAVVSAAAAAMTKWTYDYLALIKKLDQFNGMVSTGVSPGSAASLVEDLTTTSNFFSPVTRATNYIVPVLVIGGLAWFFIGRKKRR